MKNAIQPTRNENFSKWYQQIIKSADMAENSEVRGCMVIKPWGYAIWENIQSQLNAVIKETGHENAYFPLLIPLSYLEKEAEHAEGFATECAVVTHHRLVADEKDGKKSLVPSGKLNEPFVIRPTSETIIGSAFARWIKSYRDLPLLINQWANVMRWEMRPRLFLRTAEFLWQEGHTAHENKPEAEKETNKMLTVYKDFLENHLAVKPMVGEKSERERFPGAENTHTVEVLVQDNKAIQAGTSHFLGQNFSRSDNIIFKDKNDKAEFAWTTSWGVSSRLIGTLIMAHSDDDGLVLPPRLAGIQVVIIPIIPKENQKKEILDKCEELKSKIQNEQAFNEKIRTKIDHRDLSSGNKKWDWIKKGVPIRIEIGPRDIQKNSCAVYFRNKSPNEKEFWNTNDIKNSISNSLESIQKKLLQKHKNFVLENTKFIDNKNDFEKFFTDKKQIHGGFALVPWAGDSSDEEKIQNQLKVTLRCLPNMDDNNFIKKITVNNQKLENLNCFYTKKLSTHLAIFAKSY